MGKGREGGEGAEGKWEGKGRKSEGRSFLEEKGRGQREGERRARKR